MIMPETPLRTERIKALNEAFLSLMWIATKQFSQRLQAHGLTFPQFIALAALVAHKQACTMRDLTNVTFQDPPTMTGIVNRLVKMKLVERSSSDLDRRLVLVQATPSANELIEQIEAEKLAHDLSGYAVLSDDDLTTLGQLLRHVLRMHATRYGARPDIDLDAKLDQQLLFIRDPIRFEKLDTTRQAGAVD
jgi:DNA-binding MarR family transcriptional regulator